MRATKPQVVVTTGASSGIGRVTAHAFAARGGQPLAIVTDVSDQRAVTELARRAVERFERIDVWINNAGVIAYGRFEDVPVQAFRQVLETNLFG